MFLSLISGSSGNATLFSDGKTNILIDCGMSGKRLEATLNTLDLSCSDLSAILITHEHTDHIGGAGVVSKRYKLPVYATEKTIAAFPAGKIPEENCNILTPNHTFEIGQIGICPFSISHDAADPVGYTFFSDKKKYALATDTGILSDEIFSAISGSEQVLLESNHDVDMLMYGSYPFFLKKRILGEHGHLSNRLAAQTAVRLLNSGTHQIMLGHLSNENNTPQIAYQTVKNELEAVGAKLNTDITLQVASRHDITRFEAWKSQSLLLEN